MVSNIEVQLEHGFENYALTIPETREELQEAIRWSWSFATIVPDRVAGPLLGAAYAGPLSEMVVPDFILWLWGGTGSYKSTLSAVVLSHFGDFSETSLPLSFESTANALERATFLAKDVLVVVDDWRPGVSRADSEEIDRKAQRLLRAGGNRQGRGRMTSDTTLRGSYPPRGVIAVTAEVLPEGPSFESAASRALAINISREDVDRDRLSELQANKDKLSRAMAGYIQWIASHYDELARKLPEDQKVLREEHLRAKLPDSHPRTPTNAATLILALQQFRDFTVSVGAMTEAEADEVYTAARDGVVEAARAHVGSTKGGDPSTRFIELVNSLLGSDNAYLESRERVGPVVEGEEADLDIFERKETESRGKFIGWYDEDYLYFEKQAAFAAVSEYANRGGIPFGIKPNALWNHLARSGRSLTDEGRSDTTVRVKGKSRRVIQIPRHILSDT